MKTIISIWATLLVFGILSQTNKPIDKQTVSQDTVTAKSKTAKISDLSDVKKLKNEREAAAVKRRAIERDIKTLIKNEQ